MRMRTSFKTHRITILLTFFVCVAHTLFSYGVSPEEAKVAKLQADAQRGAVTAQIALAADYMTGTGVPQDPHLAARWYEQAARSGTGGGQTQIGHCAESGSCAP